MALDNNIKTQLKAYMERLVHPITIEASTDGSAKSNEMMELLNEIVEISDKINLTQGNDARKPSFPSSHKTQMQSQYQYDSLVFPWDMNLPLWY